jgi:hypothetical protein
MRQVVESMQHVSIDDESYAEREFVSEWLEIWFRNQVCWRNAAGTSKSWADVVSCTLGTSNARNQAVACLADQEERGEVDDKRKKARGKGRTERRGKR